MTQDAGLEGLFDNVEPDPANDLSLDWILLGVDRHGEGLILDASPDFFKVDLITELWACDNGIEQPAGLRPGLYMARDIRVIGSDDWVDIKCRWEALCVPASAIEAAPADETRSGSAEGESATGAAGDAQPLVGSPQ